MSEPLHLDMPNLGALEKEYLCRAIDSGFVSTIGPFVPEFEQCLATRLHAAGAVAVQSGTAALHMALHEAGIGPGDEVIVPALTFVATVNPVRYLGATPVFADVDPVTWTMDPAAVEALVTPRTRAVIPVHLYGTPCAMTEVMACAARHDLAVIEDATESLGATYDGRQTGTIGAFGCFSFNGNKTITTGGGGMIVGNDPARLDHIRFLVNQARDEQQGYYHPEVGFNYRMTNIEAALGLAQATRLDDFLARKREIQAIYREELAGHPMIRFQEAPDRGVSSFWLTCITVDPRHDLAALQQTLRDQGVPTRRVFMPVCTFPPYRGVVEGTCPVATAIFEQGLCLPSSTVNTLAAVRRAAQTIGEALP